MGPGSYEWWLTDGWAAALLIGVPVLCISIGVMIAIVRAGTPKGRKFSVIDAAALFIGLIALAASFWQGRISQDALLDQQISAAWQILAIPGGVSTGKAYALERLVAADEVLGGLKLNCTATVKFPAQYDQRAPACPTAPDLYGVQLISTFGSVISRSSFVLADMREAAFERLIFDNSDFDGTDFTNSHFRNVGWLDIVHGRAIFVDATFNGGGFVNSTLRGAIFSGATFTKVGFKDVSLAEAYLLETQFVGGTYKSIDISGATLCKSWMNGRGASEPHEPGVPLWRALGCAEVSEAFWKEAYFAAANPPEDIQAYEGQMVRRGCPGMKGAPDRPIQYMCGDNFVRADSVGDTSSIFKEFDEDAD